MTYSENIQSLAERLLIHFDNVYHSAEIIVNDSGIKLPAVPLKDGWLSLEPTDQREVVYIRRNGDDEVLDELKIGSCVKSYKMKSQLRIVFFKDHADKHSEILFNLMQSALSGSKLVRIIRDKWKLQKDESSGDYGFGATTAYFAIDVYIYWNLVPDTCEEDFCIDITNPLKKELCPAVV